MEATSHWTRYVICRRGFRRRISPIFRLKLDCAISVGTFRRPSAPTLAATASTTSGVEIERGTRTLSRLHGGPIARTTITSEQRRRSRIELEHGIVPELGFSTVGQYRRDEHVQLVFEYAGHWTKAAQFGWKRGQWRWWSVAEVCRSKKQRRQK